MINAPAGGAGLGICYTKTDMCNAPNGSYSARRHGNFAPAMLIEHDCSEKLSNLQSNGTVVQDECLSSSALIAKIRLVLCVSRRLNHFVYLKMALANNNDDYMDATAQAIYLPLMTQAHVNCCYMMTNDPDHEGDVSGQATILAVMNSLSNFRAGVDLDITRIRYWTYVFRLKVLRENPATVMASMREDNLDALRAEEDEDDDEEDESDDDE